MRMALEEVESRTRAVVRDLRRTLEVAGVVASDGEADHVELLLTLSGCHQDPCTLMVTLPRDHETFEANLRARVREALAAHGADPEGNHQRDDRA